MMGTKTLREMRDDLEHALREETGAEPIAWLKKRIVADKRKGKPTDVLESVKRVFERLPAKTESQRGKRASNGKPNTAGKRPDVLAELEAVTRALERAVANGRRPRKQKAKA